MYTLNYAFVVSIKGIVSWRRRIHLHCTVCAALYSILFRQMMSQDLIPYLIVIIG